MSKITEDRVTRRLDESINCTRVLIRTAVEQANHADICLGALGSIGKPLPEERSNLIQWAVAQTREAWIAWQAIGIEDDK